MSYTKDCRDCNQQIRMQQVCGKWWAFDVSGTGFHQCAKTNNKKAVVVPKQNQGEGVLTTDMEKLNARLNRLEKIIDAFLMAGARE